ncbi:Chlorophyll a/b binding protein domain-containing protein [Panicum miliaceum]|uniref:Chlorophyll a/b binding protein domain-containing protein n=1 Tax=Panicum miliaceum TaxID=4540 RepID=A0A3L6SQQ8_PANMI|nr:Chlorophyll a/b binding protein domain-containing protein [Panicum miliaceum]
MAQSMLMSTSVSGGRALPSLQAGRPAPYRLALPSAYRHSKSVSVKTLALFGKSKAAKAAPAKKAPAPKPKVEDGIFGTSGGIGFTKENELFVGRVAMLGFAASLLGEAITGPLFGFTKSNELFVGRLAQLGVAFSIIGEIITGKGALAQLNIETGVPINEIEPLVLFNVLFFFIAAVNPGTGKFIIGEDEE